MKMMPPDVISHEDQLQHLSEPSIFMLDVFRTADHAGQIFIPHRCYSHLPLPSLSLSVLLSHSVTSLNPSLVSPYLSLAVLLLACLCLRSLSTSASYQPRCLLPWAVLPYLPDRSLNYINWIFWCRRQFGD